MSSTIISGTLSKSSAFMIDNLLANNNATSISHNIQMPPKKRQCPETHEFHQQSIKQEPLTNSTNYSYLQQPQHYTTPCFNKSLAQQYVNAFYVAAAASSTSALKHTPELSIQINSLFANKTFNNHQLNSSVYSSGSLLSNSSSSSLTSSSGGSFLDSPVSSYMNNRFDDSNSSSANLKLPKLECDAISNIDSNEDEESFNVDDDLEDDDENDYSIDVDLNDEEKENLQFGLNAMRSKNNLSEARRERREKKEWVCATCHKIFDRPSLLQRHIRTHTGEKPHACDVCGKAFSTSSSLNTHRRIHSGEKPHACNLCGKKFTASSNLYYHKLTHTSEKPHKCTKCAKSFSTPGDLRGHMHSHNGTWPFRCDICNRGFTKQTNMKNHMLTHTGAKPFCCLKCDKQFSLACNLKSHMKTHHGGSNENESVYNTSF